MAQEFTYRVQVLRTPKAANSVGEWPDSPTLFIPVTWGTLRVLYGVAQLVIDREFWAGTEEEIAQALNTLEEQLSEYPLTIEDVISRWGAQFRIEDGQDLEAREGEYLPVPPWEFRITRQPDDTLQLEFRSEE